MAFLFGNIFINYHTFFFHIAVHFSLAIYRQMADIVLLIPLFLEKEVHRCFYFILKVLQSLSWKNCKSHDTFWSAKICVRQLRKEPPNTVAFTFQICKFCNERKCACSILQGSRGSTTQEIPWDTRNLIGLNHLQSINFPFDCYYYNFHGTWTL